MTARYIAARLLSAHGKDYAAQLVTERIERHRRMIHRVPTIAEAVHPFARLSFWQRVARFLSNPLTH